MPSAVRFAMWASRQLHLVRQGIDAVPMKQMRRDGAVPDCREPPAHVDDVVVHAEGLLDHDHGSSHRTVGNHLVGRDLPVGSGQQHGVVVHGRR